ncbi:nucleotide exchange factor GrpE [Spiroplasma cantharicola]|uniref:Protein GrpE n=1 Tax=Spiroplasma cantharicola TaxID=362837 RepID=A0A0M4JRZ3_9MOLU|nr:nucleotide exchange factor GrpE [Spiroplasma cantharicola]ALD66222.1 molecular chaperone GrpE (heat shock protein) [Spiroplasma cantharicola]
MEKEKMKSILDLFENIKKELKIDSKENKDQKNNKDHKEQKNPHENKDSKENKDKNHDKENKVEELTNIEKLELEFVALNEQIAKLEEARLIAVADNQNTVRRFQNESALVRKYGGEKLASELIPAIDMFRGVLKSTPDNPEIKNYLMGFEMIINQIDQALTNAGVTMVVVKPGDDFNPEVHSAIEQVKSEEFKSGKIAIVVSNGYKLHDRVIKHAAVKVAE